VTEDEKPRVENEALLTGRFGFWPTFHDAEMVRARLERKGTDAPFLELDIHVFRMGPEVDAKGYFVLKNHTLVTLRFCDIDLAELHSWNAQNVLLELTIRRAQVAEGDDARRRPIAVEMPSSHGCEVKLTCGSIKVIEAKDWTGD
jgi:hypothetical protein